MPSLHETALLSLESRNHGLFMPGNVTIVSYGQCYYIMLHPCESFHTLYTRHQHLIQHHAQVTSRRKCVRSLPDGRSMRLTSSIQPSAMQATRGSLDTADASDLSTRGSI
ncbi:hypothetical protein VPH35_104908 [Triticum aestivum]